MGSALLGIFIVELVLTVLAPGDELEGRARAAEKLGKPFDSRSRLQVVDALREDGVDAWPTMKPYLLLAEEADPSGEPRSNLAENGSTVFLFPLGGISKSTSVYCNESGTYSIFETDEHGFRNRMGAHSRHSVDAVIVGDSFGNGACVAGGADPAAQLSSRGLSTVSLASPGNGPLIELGTIVEYAKPLQPARVLWFYFEGNDLTNLANEMQSETLRGYLQEGFSQNLNTRQRAIDEQLRGLSNRWEAAARAEKGQTVLRRLRAWLTLYQLRSLLGWTSPDVDYDGVAERFCEVIDRSKSIVEGWGGQLTFVYLPSWYRYVSGAQSLEPLELKPTIEACVRRHQIPFVDFDEAIRELDDPLSMFSLGVNPHYNEMGYQRLADTILVVLDVSP